MKVLLASTIFAIVSRGKSVIPDEPRAIGGSLEPPETGGPLPPPSGSVLPGQLIWHGERKIATVVNKAGEWNANYVIDNMFDDSPATLWHSNGWWRSKTKIIGFEFKVRLSLFVNLVKCRTKNVF